MISLQISNFSCIAEASIELGKLTIIIGPQATGKSVISKLIYFFNNVILSQHSSIEEGEEISEFKESVKQDFLKWFPPEAWGPEKFNIVFRAAEFTVQISRVPTKATSKKKSYGRLSLIFSEYFERQYEAFLNDWKQARDKLIERSGSKSVSPTSEYERFWRLRESYEKQLQKQLGDSFTEYQLFIPAGRSFFTSLGKAVAAFEHVGILDPVTTSFGRLFASLRDRGRRSYLGRSRSQMISSREFMEQLFGGSIHFDKNLEYVQSSDGRRVPFSILSSGQQELLPLFLTLENFAWRDRTQDIYFIEEPEAHLFPTTQATLTNFLASLVSGQTSKRRILITTHSPYVLANINNLLKAGSLAAKLGAAAHASIGKVVARNSWLAPGTVKAYAIRERRACSILGDDGLINADYLDEVSNSISGAFSDLLDLEYAK